MAITGIGGAFFKARDVKALSAWYREHLGVPIGDEGYANFEWAADRPDGSTAFAIFPADTDYFSPGDAPFMLNFRVDDLDAVLSRLRDLGDPVDDNTMDEGYGRFGWVVDPEGNRIELWEPVLEIEASPAE
jgi:predicted enzyme related to lactoylglutathione lyase